MAMEIERKFLVNRTAWNQQPKGDGELYSQGYLLTEPGKTIRVRLTRTSGYLTIKGSTTGASRPEYEYAIPVGDAQELLSGFCSAVITKLRYKVMASGKLWEVDVFLGDNEGLMIAEVELEREDEQIDLPEWVGTEVTGAERYYNAFLSKHPYKEWKQ